MDVVWIFFSRYLFSQRAGAIVRTMARLSWLATLIGVFSLVVVSSVMNGFNRSIRNKLSSVEPHLTVSGDETVRREAEVFLLSESGVEVNEYVRQDVILRTVDGRFSGAVAKGLPEEAIYHFLNRISKMRFKKGAIPDLEMEQASLDIHEVLVGSDLAREMNLFEGDEIVLIPPESLLGPQGEAPRFERMRVKALVTTDSADIDSKLIVFRLASRPLRFESQVSGERGVEARFQNINEASSVAAKLAHQLRSLKEARIETWADRNQALFFALRLEKVAMMTFLGLSVLITCFSLVTVLIMLVSQKRKEIGLLMAIGFSRHSIRRLFLTLGVFLSGLGLFGGLILGVMTSLLIEKYPIDLLPDIYYDSAIPSEVNYAFVAGVAAFCLAVAFMAAYWPVRSYVRYSPSENLRQTGT